MDRRGRAGVDFQSRQHALADVGRDDLGRVFDGLDFMPEVDFTPSPNVYVGNWRWFYDRETRITK